MCSCHSKKKHRGEEVRAKGRREKSSNSQSGQSFFPGWGAGLNLLPIVTCHPHAPGLILCDATGGNPRWWRWRSGRNLLATWTWRCAQGRQMTIQSPFLRRLGTCSQLGRSSPRPHMPRSFPLHTDWILMMCSHPLADKLFKPRPPAFAEAQREDSKANFYRTSLQTWLTTASMERSYSWLPKPLFSPCFLLPLLSYSISVPFTGCIYRFPL